jgi:hypothetical protein
MLISQTIVEIARNFEKYSNFSIKDEKSLENLEELFREIGDLLVLYASNVMNNGESSEDFWRYKNCLGSRRTN